MLQFMESQRVGHDLADVDNNAFQYFIAECACLIASFLRDFQAD